MASDAKQKDLLYVSDDWANVYVFSYPRGDLEGTLTGLQAGGLCVDKVGDIFVTDLSRSVIVEYGHGGRTPIRTLDDGGYQSSFPFGCSVDPTTGNLAVTDLGSNIGGPSGTGPGKIAIYRRAEGAPEYYHAMYHPRRCSYDPRGNLFVVGTDSPAAFKFGKLRKGGKKFRYIALPQSFSFPGGVHWDGAHIAVGDSYKSVIYQFAIRGTNATEVASTPLVGASYTWDFWINASKVVAPVIDVVSSKSFSKIRLYHYPAGGQAVQTIVRSGIVFAPASVTISLAK